jgi:hypothetical protein
MNITWIKKVPQKVGQYIIYKIFIYYKTIYVNRPDQDEGEAKFNTTGKCLRELLKLIKTLTHRKRK